jgi:hypothetical protein
MSQKTVLFTFQKTVCLKNYFASFLQGHFRVIPRKGAYHLTGHLQTQFKDQGMVWQAVKQTIPYTLFRREKTTFQNRNAIFPKIFHHPKTEVL